MLIFLLNGISVWAQSYSEKLALHRSERNAEMRDTAHTPLKREEVLRFKELHFFPADSSLRIVAKFIREKRKQVVIIPTSSGKEKSYYRIGKAVFAVYGMPCTLSVFQPVHLKDHVFIPFTDLTNGNETYGGGRYIEGELIGKKSILIDFNFCYNPYCAYTTGYSCPIPPKENFIPAAIKAGEKLLWEDH